MKPILLTYAAAAVMAFAAFQAGTANAALTPRDAHAAAHKWRAAHPRPFGRALDRPSGEVMTAAANGTNLFHAVNMSGGGFAVFAASGDGAAPMAFATSGTFSETNAAPLWTMLLADSGLRGARGKRGGSRRLAGTSLPEGVTIFRTAVAAAPRLLSTHVADASGLDDLRVPPLVQSKWNQGDDIYNSYTPFYSLCGCVATAMGQIMRFHEWPTQAIAGKTMTCTYNDEKTPLAMQGGVYDWSAMPLVPNASSITDYQRQTIGTFVRDIGVSVHMNYTKGRSDAYAAMTAFAFTNTWKYAQSQYWDNFDNASTNKNDDASLGYIPINTFENAILPNLDAGFPCLLGITEGFSKYDSGHAIVADGYGYLGKQRYIHLNMGWSGSSDYWYIFSLDTDDGYDFKYLTDIVYNLFPTNTGNIVSGRITTNNGTAIAGVAVRAYDASSNLVAAATSSATGVYALIVPNEPLSLTITARRTWYFPSTTDADTDASLSYVIDESALEKDPIDGYTGYNYLNMDDTPTIGNRWGVDFMLEPRPQFLIRIR